jgi:tetratricopeptide (TPR) repeat protein
MSNLSLKSVLSRLLSDVRKHRELHRLSESILELRDKGKMVEAYQVFQEFIAKAPQLPENGDFCVFQAEFELAANHDFQKAQEFIEKAERLGCERDSFYYQVHGGVMSGTGNLEQAIADYQRSLDLGPTLSALTSLAWVLLASEDERLTSVCEKILEKDADNCCAQTCLGWQAMRSGDRARALSMGEKAEKSAKSPRDFFDVGRLYHELEHYDAAIDVYIRADRSGYREKGSLYAGIGACHLSLGHVVEARKWSELAVQFDPDNEYVQEVWHACNEDTNTESDDWDNRETSP